MGVKGGKGGKRNNNRQEKVELFLKMSSRVFKSAFEQKGLREQSGVSSHRAKQPPGPRASPATPITHSENSEKAFPHPS